MRVFPREGERHLMMLYLQSGEQGIVNPLIAHPDLNSIDSSLYRDSPCKSQIMLHCYATTLTAFECVSFMSIVYHSHVFISVTY